MVNLDGLISKRRPMAAFSDHDASDPSDLQLTAGRTVVPRNYGNLTQTEAVVAVVCAMLMESSTNQIVQPYENGEWRGDGERRRASPHSSSHRRSS